MASKIKVDTLETGNGTGSIIVNNNLSLAATSSTEGGEIKFIGSGTNADWQIDEFAGVLRIHTAGTVPFTITGDGRGLSQFTAKAWVNFNGTFSGDMTVVNTGIRDEHNVSSITDIGSGQYRLNFSNAMANANYSIFGSVIGNTQSYGFITTTAGANRAPTTSGFECMQIHHAGTNTDADYIHLMVFGD
jgi:hypothetical protein